MNNISAIITSLSVEEKKKFVQGLRLKNKRNDTKNIELFHLLNTSNEVENLDKVIYGKKAKGAYHALSKRLHDALIDFIATKNFEEESSNEMGLLKLILASRTLFKQQQYKTAIKTLAKAELKATKYLSYSILNEVYHTQISYAHFNDSLNFNELIIKYQKNKLKILEEENLNLFYATIQNELNENKPNISDIINRNLKLYNISLSNNLSYESLFKILQIGNQVANISRNYYEILDFIELTLQKIDPLKSVENKDLYYHIQILYYLSNTYFRIKQFDKSKSYLKRMKNGMSLQNKKYYNTFYSQYVLIENLLLIYTNNLDIAIEKLEAFDFQKYKNNEVYVHDLKLLLIVALSFKEKFKEAFKVFGDFYHSDKWYADKVGFIWVIKKNLLEILVLMELDYVDLVESRINSFRKKYKIHLIEHNEKKVLDFLKLITIYYYHKDEIYSQEFSNKLDRIVEISNKEEDIFTISFYAWLKSKTTSTTIFASCISYINEL